MSGTTGINSEVVDGLCINYPHTYNSEYPYFVLYVPISSDSIDSNRVQYNNCAAAAEPTVRDASWRVPLEVTDATKPAWVSIDGVIIAVFNYS